MTPDITWVNTNAYREAAITFQKKGYYTKAHPIYDRAEFDAFWDEEEDRIIQGYSVGGIRIPGDMYFYLNYCPIEKTVADADPNFNRSVKVVAAKKSFTFPDFWDGDYLYFKELELAAEEGQHFIVAKARRKGFSYKNAAKCCRVYHTMPGKISLIGAFNSESLYPDGTMHMVNKYLDHIDKHTAFRKKRLRNSMKDGFKAGFKYEGDDVEHGYLSAIIPAIFGPNKPGAARGKDATYIMFEEGGKWPNLIPSLQATLPTVEDGIFVTGQIVIFGTGDSDPKNQFWEHFEQIFYNPADYGLNGFRSFDNVWDVGKSGTRCGFYFPRERNMPGFIDANGNSLLSEARDFHDEQVRKLKETSTDPSVVTGFLSENSTCPTETFFRTGSNVFPTARHNDMINKIFTDPDIKYLSRYGHLRNVDGYIKLCTDIDLERLGEKMHPPITEFPLTKGDPHGCIQEFFPPYYSEDGIPDNLYEIWHDPYAIDKDKGDITQKDSLGVAYVYERINNITASGGGRIVASWIGRPDTMDEYNDQLFLLARRYNAKILFERDRGDVEGYAKRTKQLDWLMDEPSLLRANPNAKTKPKKGVSMNNRERKGNAVIYLRDKFKEVVHTDDTGRNYTFLDYIYDPLFHKECINWNYDGNFDRVSAMLVGMYSIKDTIQKVPKAAPVTDPNDFFNREHF